MNGLHDPVDTSIATDRFVLRIDEDHLEVFVGGVLVDPVRVEDTQIGSTAAHSLLGCRFQGSLVLKLVYTLVRWLAYQGEYQPQSFCLGSNDNVDRLSYVRIAETKYVWSLVHKATISESN